MSFNVYPLSSESGRDIPLEVVKAVSCAVYDITNTPMGIVIPRAGMSDSLVSIVSDSDCVVSFLNTPINYIVNIDMPETIFLQAGIAKIVRPNSDALSAQMISGSTGILAVSEYTTWDKLATQEQLDYA